METFRAVYPNWMSANSAKLEHTPTEACPIHVQCAHFGCAPPPLLCVKAFVLHPIDCLIRSTPQLRLATWNRAAEGKRGRTYVREFVTRPVRLLRDELGLERAYLARKMLCVRLWRADDHPGFPPTRCLPFKVHFTDRLSLGKHCMYWHSWSNFLLRTREWAIYLQWFSSFTFQSPSFLSCF